MTHPHHVLNIAHLRHNGHLNSGAVSGGTPSDVVAPSEGQNGGYGLFDKLLSDAHAKKVFVVKNGSEKQEGFYTLAIDKQKSVFKVRVEGTIKTYTWSNAQTSEQHDTGRTRVLAIYKTVLQDLSTKSATVVAEKS